MTERIAIGLDLGGTNLKAALLEADGRVAASCSRPVNASAGPQSAIAAMVEASQELLAVVRANFTDLVGAGLGTPGPLDLAKGTIVQPANLPGWTDVPIRDELARRLGCPAVLENDANAAAYGEFCAGAGRGVADMVMLTLGTGVGAGVIVNGSILHGHFGNAAELGHWIVHPEGLQCPCGQRGCLEQYASASAVARRVASAIQGGRTSVLASQIKAGEGKLDAKSVADAARLGDALCLDVWDGACRYLAIACVNVQHAFNPARIVLGGGLADAGDLLFDRVRQAFHRVRWKLMADAPEIVAASLGSAAGAIGAAHLAWSALNGARRPMEGG